MLFYHDEDDSQIQISRNSPNTRIDRYNIHNVLFDFSFVLVATWFRRFSHFLLTKWKHVFITNIFLSVISISMNKFKRLNWKNSSRNSKCVAYIYATSGNGSIIVKELFWIVNFVFLYTVISKVLIVCRVEFSFKNKINCSSFLKDFFCKDFANDNYMWICIRREYMNGI